MNLKAVFTEENKVKILNDIDHICDNPEEFLKKGSFVFIDFYDYDEILGTVVYSIEGNVLFLGAFLSYKKTKVFPSIFPYFVEFGKLHNLDKIVLVTKRNTKSYFTKLGFDLVNNEKGVKEYVFRI